MKLGFGLCAAALLAGLLGAQCNADELGDYLASNGQLKETVTVNFGNCWVAPEVRLIHPSGDLSRDGEAVGKLSAKQLSALARHLATQDLNSLPTTQGYDPPTEGIGYDYFVIKFGKKQAAFNIEFGKTRADYLPEPADQNAAAWSRFIALELMLKELFKSTEVGTGSPK